MKVESKLEVALAEAVTKTADSIDTAAGFLAAQAPEVIAQLLIWHGIKSAILCALGIVMLYIMQHLVRNCSGKGARINPDYPTKGNCRQTLTHDRDGELCPRTTITAGMAILGIVICLDLTLNNLDWLQILVAEKIWLLEYAAKIIKSN